MSLKVIEPTHTQAGCAKKKELSVINKLFGRARDIRDIPLSALNYYFSAFYELFVYHFAPRTAHNSQHD